MQGTLAPGRTQNVAIKFEPQTPFYTYEMKVGLVSDMSHTSESSSIFVLDGLGSAPLLRLQKLEDAQELSHMVGKHVYSNNDQLLDSLNIDFGSIKIGTKKKLSIMLVNLGHVDSEFIVRHISSRFGTSPDSGKVRAQSFRRLDLWFEPLTEKDFRDIIRIKWGSKRDNDLTIHACGGGGHPSLHVETKIVDFKVALIHVPSRKSLKLSNNGDAETFVDVQLPSKSFIRTDPPAPIILEPNSERTIDIIFTPREILKLDENLRIQSLENKHDLFIVRLVGLVGKPELDIHPEDSMEKLNFGTALVNKEARKEFSLYNRGNISCAFNCFFYGSKSKEHLQKSMEHLQNGKTHGAAEALDSHIKIDGKDANEAEPSHFTYEALTSMNLMHLKHFSLKYLM